MRPLCALVSSCLSGDRVPGDRVYREQGVRARCAATRTAAAAGRYAAEDRCVVEDHCAAREIQSEAIHDVAQVEIRAALNVAQSAVPSESRCGARRFWLDDLEPCVALNGAPVVIRAVARAVAPVVTHVVAQGVFPETTRAWRVVHCEAQCVAQNYGPACFR
jgi:hypothetical protein